MKYFSLFALVLCAAGFAGVQGDCTSELPACTSTFSSTAGSSVGTFCAALRVYKSCAKVACDELSASYIENIMNQASQQAGINCVQGNCASELSACTSTFTRTAGSSVGTFCAALRVYTSCAKVACDELSASYIKNIMSQASQQAGIPCGSCMLCVSLMPVLLLAFASLFFNTA